MTQSFTHDNSANPLATAVDGSLRVQPHHESALHRAQRGGIYAIGEAYIAGLWTTDRLDDFIFKLLTTPQPKPSLFAQAKMFIHVMDRYLFNRHNGRRAFNIGTQHYDLGNDLFRAMLDPSMTYTSGYWAQASTLAAAQEAKLDLLCRKLDLRPGMSVLDIGCGWGNFARYAAEHYGVHVTGVTVSQQQAEEARRRCVGLSVEIRLQDYRAVTETFDRVVSIEMIEAVGRKNLPTFYRVVEDRLNDDGIFVLQAITGDTWSRTSDRRLDEYSLWLVTYIFPDGYLPTQRELSGCGSTSLRIEDWQSFGQDYDRTLLAWADNFANHWDELKNRYDEAFRRRWEFYLCGCAAAFRANRFDVCQIVYSKSSRNQCHVPQR